MATTKAVPLSGKSRTGGAKRMIQYYEDEIVNSFDGTLREG